MGKVVKLLNLEEKRENVRGRRKTGFWGKWEEMEQNVDQELEIGV